MLLEASTSDASAVGSRREAGASGNAKLCVLLEASTSEARASGEAAGASGDAKLCLQLEASTGEVSDAAERHRRERGTKAVSRAECAAGGEHEPASQRGKSTAGEAGKSGDASMQLRVLLETSSTRPRQKRFKDSMRARGTSAAGEAGARVARAGMPSCVCPVGGEHERGKCTPREAQARAEKPS